MEHRKPSRLSLEPAVVRGVIVAVVTLLVASGLVAAVDDKTVDAVLVLVLAVAPILSGLWTRYGVTPNAEVVTRVDVSAGTVVAGDAAERPTGAAVALLPTDAVPVTEPVGVNPALLAS